MHHSGQSSQPHCALGVPLSAPHSDGKPPLSPRCLWWAPRQGFPGQGQTRQDGQGVVGYCPNDPPGAAPSGLQVRNSAWNAVGESGLATAWKCGLRLQGPDMFFLTLIFP